ncbi:MAG: DMT family transporter [Mogibacterium sp.]|nr:DMT family transporter [Mogibacterium sp.]
MGRKAKGNIALLLTAIIWGTGFIGQKVGLNSLPPIGFNGTRQFMAGILLIPLAVFLLRKAKYFNREVNTAEVVAERKTRSIKGGIVCGIIMAFATNLQQIGLVTVSAGKSGFITAIYIVMVPIIAIFFGRKITVKVVYCCAIAMAGFALLSLKGGLGGTTVGDWLTLASAFGFSLQMILIEYYVDDNNDILISSIQMCVAGATSLIVSLIFETMTISGIIACMPVLLYMAFIPTAGGYTLQIVGQKYTDSTTAAFLLSLESVFAAIFGALLLGESMTPRELCGCALIFFANLLIQRGDKPVDKLGKTE